MKHLYSNLTLLVFLFSYEALAQKLPLPVPSGGDPPSACDAVPGNLVMNCGFETGDASKWLFTPAASGSVFAVYPTSFNVQHTGNFAAWFGGITAGSYDAIQQTITTSPGQQYDLSFWLASLAAGGPGSGRDFQVYWNGVKIYDYSSNRYLMSAWWYWYIPLNDLFPYMQVSLTVVGTGNDVLKFQGYNVPNGDVLDDIVLKAH